MQLIKQSVGHSRWGLWLGIIALSFQSLVAPAQSELFKKFEEQERLRVEITVGDMRQSGGVPYVFEQVGKRIEKIWLERKQREGQYYLKRNFERAPELIVMLQVDYQDAQEFGAGIIFGHQQDRLLIATAYHLLHRGPLAPRSIKVKLRTSPEKLLEATVLKHSQQEELDLAVISIDGLAKKIDIYALPFQRLGQVAKLKRGDGVFAVGNPNGVSWAMPVVADRVAQIIGKNIVFQSAFISSGHSGGGLIDERAHLVGMTTADSPPFGRALNLDTILRQVQQWGYPVLLRTAGKSTLHVAAENGDLVTLKKLLADYGPHSTDFDFLAGTPLHSAAAKGQLAALSLLLKAGARLDDSTMSITPLGSAVIAEQLESVKLLLQAGADVNARSPIGGETPLHWAVKYNRWGTEKQKAIIELLVAAGADVNAKDAWNWKPHNWTIDTSLDKLLSDQGANK